MKTITIKEGSAEWALYQMIKGEKICHYKSPSIMCCEHAGYIRREVRYNCVDHMSVSVWLNGADKNGWQIYDEPKPKSKNIIHGYIPGDWVEFINARGHKLQGKYLSNACDHAFIVRVRDTTHNTRCVVPVTKIIRKLDPSEVVLDFGSGISGTIKRWDSTTFHIFHGNSKFSKIHIDALDTETRELVESLLREEK